MQLQYIGARYVPVWYHNSVDDSANWEVNVEYEPLTWVTTQNNHLYLSKKAVPDNIGTPAQNTEYWLDMGTFSGSYADLQTEIENMKDGTIEDSLQYQINANSDRIGDLENANEKNIIVIGNSYVNSATAGVANMLMADFDHSYKYVSSGIGFTQFTGHSDTFELELDNAILDSAFENDTITDILFVSAMGDSMSLDENESAFSTNLATTLESIQNKIAQHFPNCKRVMVTLAETRSVAYFTFCKYNTLFKLHRTFNNILGRYGFEYLGWSGFNVMLAGDQYTLSDHYHPSDLGAKFIGGFIRNSYYGHAEYVKKESAAHINFKYTNTAKLTVVGSFTPDICKINLEVVNDNSASAAVVITANHNIALFDEMPIPIPPALGYPVYGITDLENYSNGNRQDRLVFEIGRADSNGVGVVYLVNNPGQSTIGGTKFTLPSMANITYLI